jgi:hypothetical protein
MAGVQLTNARCLLSSRYMSINQREMQFARSLSIAVTVIKNYNQS